MRTVQELANEIGLSAGDVREYGEGIGKIPVALVRDTVARRSRGKLVLVTGMTPDSHGEGKTVTTIGLAMALRQGGHRAIACLRQPSLGPVFGIKGGATGGGRATVEPAVEINLGLSGDFDAVTAAHNLLAAVVDNHLYHGNALGIDPPQVTWPRAMDVGDRALRHIVLNAEGSASSGPRPGGFVITAASEVMAILGLSRDYTDLKERLGRILVAARTDGTPVRAADLHVAGAMAALLRHALQPNLVQAVDGTPVLVHGGPFGNIAHGTCSRLSIELGLSLCEYTVVEAGFATELGAEKFVDIAGRIGEFEVSAGVLVVTLRGLRHQGGAPADSSDVPSLPAVTRGLANLGQHLANLSTLGIPAVVAINRFPTDTAEEIEAVATFCRERGVPAVPSKVFSEGSEGGRELALAVVARVGEGHVSRFGYPIGTPPLEALELLVTRFYGGRSVRVEPDAAEQLATFARWDESAGPVCVAKTPLSLSDDPKVLGGPSGFTATVRRFSRSAGAGFTVAYLGTIQTMPGLPSRPAAESIDLDADGRVLGLR
ncbi:MAG: formate--tetrahydrofolate ligase [Thermoplasmata archaeon]|nr:formate--tetrahydrofolate ligase [Thermoplasmata archaeon]